jgi:uncharacterized membrane protein
MTSYKEESIKGETWAKSDVMKYELAQGNMAFSYIFMREVIYFFKNKRLKVISLSVSSSLRPNFELLNLISVLSENNMDHNPGGMGSLKISMLLAISLWKVERN